MTALTFISLLAQVDPTTQPVSVGGSADASLLAVIPWALATLGFCIACYYHGHQSGYLVGYDCGQDSSDRVRRCTEQAILKAFARHESPTTSVVAVLRKALDLIESPPPAPQDTPEEDDEDDDDDDDQDEDEEDD